MDEIKGLDRTFHQLKKAGTYNGRNVVDIAVKMSTTVRTMQIIAMLHFGNIDRERTV